MPLSEPVAAKENSIIDTRITNITLNIRTTCVRYILKWPRKETFLDVT